MPCITSNRSGYGRRKATSAPLPPGHRGPRAIIMISALPASSSSSRAVKRSESEHMSWSLPSDRSYPMGCAVYALRLKMVRCFLCASILTDASTNRQYSSLPCTSGCMPILTDAAQIRSHPIPFGAYGRPDSGARACFPRHFFDWSTTQM